MRLGEHNGLFDVQLVHSPHPLGHFRVRPTVVARVHVDDRKTGPLNVRDRHMVNGTRPVILEQELLRLFGSLSEGAGQMRGSAAGLVGSGRVAAFGSQSQA
jgi:hypothetical protein